MSKEGEAGSEIALLSLQDLGYIYLVRTLVTLADGLGKVGFVTCAAKGIAMRGEVEKGNISQAKETLSQRRRLRHTWRIRNSHWPEANLITWPHFRVFQLQIR